MVASSARQSTGRFLGTGGAIVRQQQSADAQATAKHCSRTEAKLRITEVLPGVPTRHRQDETREKPFNKFFLQ
ncbi:MAG: hypothetical protein A3A97_04140 [Candidatus Terrybacteria bacterium RIFCSPLOWO2_01_FULL_40_23]|uniref:Uncharacterized protein n=1 Tax=Candidatus Terrybacteria bacterium RIFCSPLOWO2_01_FULL_40_23 TaxID=1802366 RepID=A0A1G2PQL6_9BACT|nr:MAG: hypothetical protein A3A97_04140 [Candidatus Terrybacteria bacterium RIFCSPLOWO2_01_FULL_40_23]